MKNDSRFGECANWVWLNGEMLPWQDASSNVCTHGLNYGTGVFEGIRAYHTVSGTALFRLDAHLDRFFASAATYGIPISYSKVCLAEATLQVARASFMNNNGGYIRPLCWLGAGFSATHHPAETAIIAWPWSMNLPEERSRAGLRVGICPWRKIHYSMLPSTAKGCGQYLSSLLAVRYAWMNGFDEALLLDTSGNLAEGPAENIFLVKDNKLLTNDEKSSILLGITRDSVIRIAQDAGIPVEIRALVPEDLFGADEAFFTGTAVEIVPIKEVNGNLIGTGNVRPVIEHICEIFRGITTGVNAKYSHWLQLVPALSGEAVIPEPAA